MPEEDARVICNTKGYWAAMNEVKEGPFESLEIAREKLGEMLKAGRNDHTNN